MARRRARAIERLADEMELQRGEDLGAVLKALLEPDTWSQAANTFGEEFAAGGRRSRLAAVPLPEEEPEVEAPPALTPVPPPPDLEPAPEAEPTKAAPAAEAAPSAAPAPAEAASASPAAPPAPSAEPAEPASPDPIAEMLAERQREAPDPPRRAVPLALVGLGIAALVGAAGIIGATQFGDNQRITPRGTGGGGEGTRDFVPEKGGPLAAPFPTEPGETTCYSTASIRRSTVLFREPGGRKRLRITPRTEWGSARILGVVSQRGDWLGVQAS